MNPTTQNFSHLFFERASVGLNLCRMDGYWMESNPAFLKMIGYSKEEADSGKLTYWQLTPRKYDDMEKIQLESLVQRGTYGPYEKEFIRKDGSLIPVRLNGFMVEMDGQEFIWSIIEDLSSVRSLELRVEETQAFLNTVIENIPLAVFVKNVKDDFKVTLWNKTAEEIFQVPREMMLGKTAHEIWPKEEADFYLDVDRRVAGDGVMVDIPVESSKTKDRGTILLRTRKLPLRAPNSDRVNHLLCISEDITEDLRARAHLITTQKLAALGEMAAGFAHEVNNPLAIIKGSADLLAKQIQAEIPEYKNTQPAITGYLTSIHRSIERIAKLIQSLASFSRNSSGDPFLPTPVKAVVEASLELCRMKFSRHMVELRVPEVPELVFDCRGSQVSQILVNLLSNSCDAVAATEGAWAQLDIIRENQNWLDFVVTDSGNRIPDDIAKQIMNPFFTTKEVGRGTGLGLSISQSLAKDHGGELFLDRNSSNTRFVLRLPLRPAASRPS